MITNPPIIGTPENEFRTDTISGFDATSILGSIEFRVVRSGAAARRMRINSARCTLGSGEGCTVRLDDPTLRPMHAVILRDTTKVLLRAYTVPIEVNGNFTAETLLNVGDRFTLGSYHFELVYTPDLGINQNSLNSLPDAFESSTPVFARDEPHPVEADLLGAASDASPFSLMSHLLEDDSRESARRKPLAKRPTRLTFIGGVEYVSEAVQSSLNSADVPKTTLELSQKAVQRLQAEQLRREVATWRHREQEWKQQEAQTRSELSEAIARFHESQRHADEASDAVKQMRKRVSQLTEEIESLAKESATHRERAERAKERYKKAVEAASEARDEAIRQRDEAELKIDQASILQIELIRERDLLREERDAAIAERNKITEATQDAAEDRHRAALQDTELAKVSQEFAIQQATLALQREEIQNVLNANDQQSRVVTEKLAQSQHRIDVLSDELSKATEKMVAARGEVAAAQIQIESLSAEVSKQQAAFVQKNDASEQSKQEYETLIAQLRTQISLLETDYATVCKQLASAESDSDLVDSLNERLAESESRRLSNNLQWEQEAKSLQANIEQLSHELESAATQLSQKDLEHETTQAELNSAYDRLTSVRRELATRPTTEQWDELQKQLVETEQQLEEIEMQIAALRQEYEHLQGISNGPTPSVAIDTAPALTAFPPSETPSVTATSDDSFSAQTHDEQSELLATQEELRDNGWPTYGFANDDSFNLAQDIDLDRIEASSNVADRLSSYTSYEKAQRLSHAPIVSDADVLSDATDVRAEENAFVQGISDLSEPVDERTISTKEPSLGILAKQLLAELNTEHSPTPLEDETSSASQALSPWNSSPTGWKLPDKQSTSDFDSQDQDSEPRDELQSLAYGDSHRSPESWHSSEASPAWNASFAPSDDIDSEEEDSGYSYMFTGSQQNEIVGAEASGHSISSPYSRSLEEGSDDGEEPLTSEDNEYEAGSESVSIESEHITPQDTYSAIAPAAALMKHEPAPDDDSIEAYMNRLLQRVQGQSSASVVKPAVASSGTSTQTNLKSNTQTARTVQPESTLTADLGASSKPSEVINSNAPIVPRSQAPEDAVHLQAMRELANASANSAISQSARGQAEKMKSKALVDLFQAAVVLTCAFAFYTCGEKISSLRYVWYTAAALAAALSLFFVLDMLKKLSAAKATYDDISEPDDDDTNFSPKKQ